MAATKRSAAARRQRDAKCVSDTQGVNWRSPNELAAFTGLSVERLRSLRRKFACGGSRGSGTSYVVDAFELFGRLADAAETTPESVVPDSDERRRLTAARADREELRLARERGDLIPFNTMTAALDAAGDSLRRSFERAIKIDPDALEVINLALDESFAAMRAALEDL